MSVYNRIEKLPAPINMMQQINLPEVVLPDTVSNAIANSITQSFTEKMKGYYAKATEAVKSMPKALIVTIVVSVVGGVITLLFKSSKKNRR